MKKEPTNTQMITRVSGLEDKTVSLGIKTVSLEGKVNNLGDKVTRLEGKVNGLSNKVDRMDVKITRLEKSVDEIKDTTVQILEAVGVFSNNTEKRFEKLENRVGKIEVTMVTKEYLDEKLLNLRADLLLMMRKGNLKLEEAVAILCERKAITPEEAKRILAMEPFPSE